MNTTEEHLNLVIRRKLIIWFVRTALGIAIAAWLASKYSWGKWVLWGYPVLALLSLTALITMNRVARRQIQQTQLANDEPDDD